MKTKSIIAAMALMMSAALSAQTPIQDQIKLHTADQDKLQLKDQSCLIADATDQATPGDQDQLRDQLRDQDQLCDGTGTGSQSQTRTQAQDNAGAGTMTQAGTAAKVRNGAGTGTGSETAARTRSRAQVATAQKSMAGTMNQTACYSTRAAAQYAVKTAAMKGFRR